ncbi:SLC13 family permease [Maribacter antarcticus]|uniref:SLC13 family permease n=1 Tax=Maribacter antarcticus TaxID=505250 RepID=UPI000478EC12|nr:DASS family sodium-coupled anion symporter [Maribacter antarcticus]
MNMTKGIGRVLGPLSFFLILNFFHPIGYSQAANAVLASTVWIAIWCITEAIPIAVTALLPLVLFPLSGGLDLSPAAASFKYKYIFLYMGGFIIAIAIEKWNLHKRITLTTINFIGSDVREIILSFMVATTFLSMWISNTATTLMILPIGMAITKQLKDNPDTIEDLNQTFRKALMLAIAYSASIGGVATLIGTPPNLVLAGVVLDTYAYEITFMQWFSFGLPISIILLFVCWKYLTRYAFHFKQTEFPVGKQEVKNQLSQLGKLSYEEKMVALVFAFASFCWISRSFLLQKVLPALDDTIIAVFFAILLFLIPAKNKREQLINWQEAVKMPCGIILLFGGGMFLAKGFEGSGLAVWIGSQMTALSGLLILLLIFVLVAGVNFLTKINANLATAAMLLPVLVPMALTIDVHPFILMFGGAVAASCAFMLPVATPPNAVVFGSGYLRIPDMVRKGIFMNVVSIFTVTLFVYFALPELSDFIIDTFPEQLKK